LYKENFGETMSEKQDPAIFVFEVDDNKINRLHYGDHLEEETNYPQCPIFDEKSSGIVFSALDMPVKKLGIASCLNRKSCIFYCAHPAFEKESVPDNDSYLQLLNLGDFVGFRPHLSDDFTRLAYFSSTERFLSHSGNY
jgi:hypothetical protein